MEFSVLLADLRDVAEKYKGKTTEPQVSTNAYVDMFTKILKRAEKSTENYDDKITVLWVALNQLASIYKDLSAGLARDQLCKFIFGLCAKTVLNIQWSQLDEDSKVRINFSTTVENVHEILSQLGFLRFQLILNLMESHWTHPILSKIMSGDDEDTDDCLEYIQKEDPEILKLRIEIMMNENCEEFALNLCNWSLKHPALQNDLKIKEQQIYILYKQQEYEKMQEVCETIVCHDGIKVMSHLAQNQANQNLCIRLAQVFLIQDWINPERTCCTQELLQVWIHHQYLADKDEERFLDSIWTVAKVCRDTEQIGVLIDGVKKECGDMFIQLYTELCKYAINIDKGNLEREEVQNDAQELSSRKLAMSKTCVRMAFMLKEYDFRMSRICGLTAFALEPTMDNLNLVNKLYWTHKNVSAASKNSKIDIATLYEIERLLGLMRHESLKPEYSWKQLIPLCKKFKADCENEKFGKSSVSVPVQNFPAESPPMPHFIRTIDKSNMGNVQNKVRNRQPQLNTKDIEKAHLVKLLGQKNIPPDQIERILSKHFPRNTNKELHDGPPLNMKQLDKTIDDLKKSIYLETEYRESMKQSLSSLQRSKKGDSSVHSSSAQNQHVSRVDQFSSQYKHSSIQRQLSAPGSSNTQGNNVMHRQTSVGSRQPPTAHSHHRQQQYSPVRFGGSPPPAHSSVNRITSPVGVAVDGSVRLGSPSELGNNHKNPYLHHSSHSKSVSEQLSKRIKEGLSRNQHQKTTGNIPFNILRPPGNDKQECAKIAQQIAELHERKRAERERLEKIRLQGHLDGVKAVLNSRNIASRSQISDLLTLTLQGNKSLESLPNSDNLQGKSYGKKKPDNSPTVSSMNPMQKSVPAGLTTVSGTPGSATGRSKQGTPEGTVTKASSKKAHASILRQGEKTWDPKRGMMKQKYYLSTECVKSADNKLQKTTSSDSNLSVKPVYSMIVPKSLTNPERTEELVNAVTNIIKNFPQGDSVPRVSLHDPHLSGKLQNVASVSHGKKGSTSTDQNVNMSTAQNVSNQGSVGSLVSGTSVPLVSNCNNSTVGLISQNGLCIPVTGHTAAVVSGSDNNLLNLNTLASASVSVLGQAAHQHPQVGEQFRVSLQQPQQLFSPVMESQQLFTTIQTGQAMQQVCQQPDPIFATPLYSVAQPLVVEPNIAMTGIQTQIDLSQTMIPQVNTIQNQPITLDTGQFTGAVNHQQASFQIKVSNNMTNCVGNNPLPVQATAQKQCLAAPELSPALVQQLLTSIKTKTAQVKNTEKIQAPPVDKKSNQTTAKSATDSGKQTPEYTKDENDEVLQRGVLEAQQKILQLRKHFEKVTGATSTGKKKHYAGGIMETLVADDAGQETVKSKSDLATFMSPVPSLTRPNRANTAPEIVPDLPDLGAKEFHIDDLLALDNDAENSARRNQVVDSISSVTADASSKGSNVSNISSTIGPNNSGTSVNTDMRPDRAQSTYFNANRLAKERENREAKTLDVNKPSKSCAKETRGKGFGKCINCDLSFSTWKQLEDHKANTNCGKPFKCDFCQMAFKSLELLNTHEKNYCLKAPTTIVKCHICGVYFESHEQLKAHLVPRTCSPHVDGHNGLQQNSNDIVCGICERKVESMTAMKEHVKKGCLKKTTVKREFNLKDYEYVMLFQCSHCNFTNSAERTVLKHVEKCKEKNSLANMMKRYKCRMCNEIFTVTEDICRHVSKQCPKLRVTNNQKHVQDTYQKLKTANMLQNDASKSPKAVVGNSNMKNQNCDPRTSCADLSEKVPFTSEVSDDKKHSNLKDANEKSDLNVSRALLNPNSGLIDSVGNVEGETHEKKEIVNFGEDVKPVVTGNDCIDETTIKLQKERRISAEKKFLAEFNEIERRKQEIRMRKQREIAMRKESMEKEERERIERDNLEAEKRKFIENILGKVTLQEKIKTETSSQRKVYRVELRKQPDEVKHENKRIVEEVHTDDNEDALNEQKRQDKSLNVRRSNHDSKSVSRKSWNIKEETKEHRKYLEDVSPNKRRRKSSEEVEDVVDKATKRLKGNSELSLGSQTSPQKTETKKKRLSPQDIRKLKGLRAKRLIKQKKYYMDEMDPVRPNKRNVDSVEKKVLSTKVTNKRTIELVEKKASAVKISDEKRKRAPRTPSGDQGFENELKRNEQKYLNECRFCEIRNKPYFGKKFYLIMHYVRGHKLGYRNVNYQHLCNFCKQRYPSSQTAKIKRHVYMSHPRSVLQNVASGKYDYLVGHMFNSRGSPLNKSKNKFGMSGRTSRRNDKMKKHLRALALRQKCAEKLKRIAMHADDSVDDSSEAEEILLISTSSTDGEMSNKEVAKTTVSKSGRKIAPRLDRQLVHHSKRRRRSSGTGNDTEEIGPRRLLRSRSSSVSSNRSSIIVSAKKRKAAMTTIGQKSSSSGERILVTRSGRAVRRPDITLSQSTESSGMDDDTSELEDASIKKRKSARIRKLSDKGKSAVEPSESDDSVSDEATVRVTRRSLRVQLNETTDNKLTSRTRRSSGRNTERSTEKTDDQAIARKRNSTSSAMSHGEKRKFVREERMVTRQNSKNEEESDSETEGSYTDTESTLKSVNAKARRCGERSAESDSESTSYDDRRKRYRFRRRVNKHVYQESESENDDTERRTTANDDSEFEFSDELEEFRSTDARNSFEDEKSMAKVFEKPKRVLVGLVSDDQSDTAYELHDDFVSESSSPKMTKGGFKSKPVILAQNYDDEFAGLELESAREILHAGKDAECELIEKSVEEGTTEHDVGKTMDEMLELIPVLSEKISRKTGKTRSLKDSVTKSSVENAPTPSKLSTPFMNAEFLQVRDTPDHIRSNLKFPSERFNKEHLKTAIVVMKDIALEVGISKCKMQKDKLIEACLKETCVVKINRLSDCDYEKHHLIENKNKNNIFGIDTNSVEDSDERSTEQDVSNSESKIGGNENQHSMKSTVKSNMSENDVTEVLIQDADITYSIDQLIAEESTTDCFNTDTGKIKINADIDDSNVHPENDVERNSFNENNTNSVDVKSYSCPVEDKCSAEMQGGEDVTGMVGKANGEVSVINNSIVIEEPNEDIWIENAETYAESTDEIKNDQFHGSENLNSEVQNLDDKEEVSCETDNRENGNEPDEPGQLVNEQEIIIDPLLSENILCTIGNGEDSEETVLQIQVDADTDILQLVVESSSDGTSANIVVAEQDVCIEPEIGLDHINEKSIDMLRKDDNVAEIIIDNNGNGEILESDTGNAALETDTAVSVSEDHGQGLQVDNLSVESAWSNEVENIPVSNAGTVSPSSTILVSSKLDAEYYNIDSTTDVIEIMQEKVNSPVKIIKCSEVSDGFDSIGVTTGTNDEQKDLSSDLNLTNKTDKVDDDEVTESSNDLIAHNDNSMSKSDVNNQSKNHEMNVLNNTDTVEIHTAVASDDKSVNHASDEQDTLSIESSQNLLVTSISNNASLLTLQTYSDSESDIEMLNLNTNMAGQDVLEDSDIELIDLNTTIADKQTPEVEYEISVNESSDPVFLSERSEQNQREAFATNKVEENDDSFNDSSKTLSSKPNDVSSEDSHNKQLLVSATASYTESNAGVETEEIDDSVVKESRDEPEQPEKTHLDAVKADTLSNLSEVHNISCIQANLINEMPAPYVSSNDSVCSTSGIIDECNDRKGLLAKMEDSSVSCSNCVKLLEPCSEIYESSSNLNLNESNLKITALIDDNVELPFQDDVKNAHNIYTNETLVNNVMVDDEEQPNSGTKSSSVCDHKDNEVKDLEKQEDPKLTDISAESNANVDEAGIRSVTALHDSNELVSVDASKETKDSGKYVTDIKSDVEFRDKNEVTLDAAGAEINVCGENSVAIETLNDRTSVSVVEPVESALIESMPFQSTDKESIINNTCKINIIHRNSCEEVAEIPIVEVTACVTIIQDKQESVSKDISEESEKIAAKTMDNVVGDLLPTDSSLENGDVCADRKETHLDTELEKTEDDMKMSSPVACFEGSKDEKVVCGQVESDNKNSDDKDEWISSTEDAEPCAVVCTLSLNTDAAVSNCDKNEINSEIDKTVNLEVISGETTDDICSKIPQESNFQTPEEIGNGKSGEICNVSPEERSPKILTEVCTDQAGKISCRIPENTNIEIKQETICSEDPVELVVENTMLDNSSVIHQPFIQNKQVTTSTSEFSLVTCGSNNEGSVESQVDNSGKKESQSVESAALSDVKFESSLNQIGFENNKASVNEIPYVVCSETSDDVYKTLHEKSFEKSDQCMLGSGSIQSVESGKVPNIALKEGIIECKPEVISGNKLDVSNSDIQEVTQQIKAEDRIVDVPNSTDKDTSVDVVKGGSGTCSVFPVFRRKGMVCVEKRPRTKLKDKSPSKKGSANDGKDKKLHRSIKSKRSGSPTRTSVAKKSVRSRSQSGGNKLPDMDMDAHCETIPAVSSSSPSSKSKCVSHGCVKQEARVKSRSLSPESSKHEAGNGKNAMVKQNDKSQLQLIEQTNKNSAKKITNHANAKRMCTTKTCNKISSGDKIKTNGRKDKTMEKEKQQSDDATVGSIFKRVKFPVVATNTSDPITCYQREDETDEEFRRRTENVRQARRKSAAKSYESDFNFENSNAKSSDSSPKLQSSSFWPSDSDTNVDATSFYSNSSGASGSPGVRDGNTKLNRRLARDFGHEDIASSLKKSAVENAPIGTRLTVVATSHHQTLKGKSDIGRIHDVKPSCPQVVEKSFLSEKMKNVSAAFKRGSKSMHSVVQDLASDLKDEVSMGDVHISLENVALGKVKAFRALRQERRPFNWEESPNSPKKRKPHTAEEITSEVKNIMGKDRKSNMQRINKVATTGTRTDQSTTRILREKKGKESTSDKAAIEKKDVKKPDSETRRTKNVNENKSAERPVVRTRSMSGSLERPKSCTGKAVNKNDEDGEKQVKADTPKKAVSAKLSSPSVQEESSRRTVKQTRLLRSVDSVTDNSNLHLAMECVDDKNKIHLEIGLTTLEDTISLQSLNDDHIKKECKLDGTSTSPEIRNQSRKKEIESSDDESTRPACRQVIHGGKVFEIQRGRVLETDLQDLTMKTTLQVTSSEQPPTTVPESVVIKRSRRISDQRKRALSPEGIVDSNMCLNSGSTDINKYIRDTLKDIKKLRKNNSPWTFQKSAAKKSQRTYPYAFKKS